MVNSTVNISVNYPITIVNSTNDITLRSPINTLQHKCGFCCYCQEQSSLNELDTLLQTSVATRGLHFAILACLLSFVQICVA